MKAYYIIRKDLGMSPAKLAVQVGHGTVLLNQAISKETWIGWIQDHEMKKIVVEVSSEEKLKNIYAKVIQSNFIDEELYGQEACVEIYDNGHTELDGLTLTGLVVFLPEENIPSYIKRLRLYS